MIIGPANFYEDGVRPQRPQLRRPPGRPPLVKTREPEPPVPPPIPPDLQAWKETFKAPPLAAIMAAVCLVTGQRRDEVKSPMREVHLVMARFLFYHLARELTKRSYPEIGQFCNRDHTSVMSGVRKVRATTAYAPFISAAKKLLGVE